MKRLTFIPEMDVKYDEVHRLPHCTLETSLEFLPPSGRYYSTYRVSISVRISHLDSVPKDISDKFSTNSIILDIPRLKFILTNELMTMFIGSVMANFSFDKHFDPDGNDGFIRKLREHESCLVLIPRDQISYYSLALHVYRTGKYKTDKQLRKAMFLYIRFHARVLTAKFMYRILQFQYTLYESDFVQLNDPMLLAFKIGCIINAFDMPRYMRGNNKPSKSNMNRIHYMRYKAGEADLLIYIYRTDKYLYDLIKSDLVKYPKRISNYVFSEFFGVIIHENPSITYRDLYLRVCSEIPEIVKRAKYFVQINSDMYKLKLDELGFIPDTRFRWFTYIASVDVINIIGSSFNLETSPLDIIKRIALKSMFNTGIDAWRSYFKIVGRSRIGNAYYSIIKIKDSIQYISDGYRIYSRLNDNTYNIDFRPMRGSFVRMVKNSYYNHNQERVYNRLAPINSKDYLMPYPLKFKFPKWIEDIRLKSAHALIIAGKDCSHCLGGYTHSNDYFFREGDVCAQVDHNTLTVRQCFNYRDTRTPLSQGFRDRLDRDLVKLRKEVDRVENGYEQVCSNGKADNDRLPF